jgi:hypothetical protein
VPGGGRLVNLSILLGTHQAVPKEGNVLVTILVILVIIVLALFIWRNMVGRRV